MSSCLVVVTTRLCGVSNSLDRNKLYCGVQYKQTTVRRIYIYMLNTYAVVYLGIHQVTNTHTRKAMSTFLCINVSIQKLLLFPGRIEKYKNKTFSIHNNQKQKRYRQLTSVDIICIYKYWQTLRIVVSFESANCFIYRKFIKYSYTKWVLLFQQSAMRTKTASLSADGRRYSGWRRRNNIEESERNAAAATAAGSISKTRQPAPTFPLFFLSVFFFSFDDPQPY